MRSCGTLPSEADANRFSDYLLTLNIQSTVDEGNGGYQVWIRDEDHLQQARDELAQFQQDPANERYRQAARPAQQIRQKQEKADRQFRKNMVDARTMWSRPLGRIPLTILLIAVSVWCTLFTNFGRQWDPITKELVISAQPFEAKRVRDMDLDLPEIRDGEVWRLVTPIFIHLNTMHILFNMMWLYQLGSAVELRKGWLVYAGIVLFSAACSNLGQWYWVLFSEGLPSPAFGMSGVVYALFGYVWMQFRYNPSSRLYMNQVTVNVMIIWLFVCMTGWLGPIANAAHVVGLVTGMILGAAPPLIRKQLRPR